MVGFRRGEGMTVVLLAKVSRPALLRARDPSGLRFQKINGCACLDLMKGRRKRRKLRGSTKAFLEWLETETAPFADDIAAFLASEAKRCASAASSFVGKAFKLKSVPEPRWEMLYGVLNDKLVEVFRDKAKQALIDVGVRSDARMVQQLDERAVEYADARSAELVGMRRTKSGKLITNPNPTYAISETTREGLQELISNAVTEGLSAQELRDEIIESWEFSASRAETIARTELAFAHTNGNMAGWQASGQVEKKQSILGSEHDLDDVCNDNADAGPIPLDEEFPSGHQLPPYHPNCVCDVIPILGEETS